MFLPCAKRVCMHRRVRSLQRHLNPSHLWADFLLNAMETPPGRQKDVSALDRRQVWRNPFTPARMCYKRGGGGSFFFRNPEEAAQFWRIEEKRQKRRREGGGGGGTAAAVGNHLHPFEETPGGEKRGECAHLCRHKCVSAGAAAHTCLRGWMWRG